MKQFLGLVGYYRRFVAHFAQISKPLNDLLKKNRTFIWNEESQRAFDELKNILCSRPLLQYPDFNEPFIVTTDASDYALGAVLSQGHVGRDLPIANASRVLNGAELSYSVIEKELLAIVFAVKLFRPYLYGRRFWLVTDHHPLTWLYQLKDPTLNSRLARWKTKLQEFEHEIVYKPGRVDANADALSRNPVPVVTKDENKVSFPKVENLRGIPQTAAGVFSSDFWPDPGKYFSEYPIERVFVSKCVREEFTSSEDECC